MGSWEFGVGSFELGIGRVQFFLNKKCSMISDIQKRARQTGLDIIYVCSLFAEYTGILGDSKTDNPKQYQCG